MKDDRYPMKYATVCIAALLAVVLSSRAVSETIDWAYEISERAKVRYINRETAIPCTALEKLLAENNSDELYIAIRDAALFGDKDCMVPIRRNIAALNRLSRVKDAVAYYQYAMGDKSMLTRLATSYDREGKQAGDHWTVEIFGYLPDWDVTGIRLVQHAKFSDGVAAEELCSALAWRRFLYGEVVFRENWFSIGRKLGIPDERLKNRYEKCWR
jgi:hypothetical protein